MLSYLEVIIYGIVQGLTEFLPISSSGHLLLISEYFNFPPNVSSLLEASVHVGSLLAVAIHFTIIYTKRLKSQPNSSYVDFVATIKRRKKWLWAVIIGSIPLIIIGGMISLGWPPELATFENTLSSLTYLPYLFIINGLILIIAEIVQRNRYELEKLPNYKIKSLVIGLCQVIAILPGISRSGITISAGNIQHIKVQHTVTLSILLGVVALIGAMISAIINISVSFSLEQFLLISVAFVASVLCSYVSLRLIYYFVKKLKMRWFGIYSILIGTTLLIVNLTAL